ncbi:unnamed protein product [Linum tenue]|uniref:TF-B3 domain-containing protein n=1 Tax=Linum tenue TaxID=586396 RepID=A0AAV0NF79_9ROSI|nr:unnamed protein product [Linum tenue]
MTIPQVKKEQEKNGRPGKVKVSSSNKQERGIVPTKSGFKRATSETVYVNGEVKDAVMKRAQELEASLPRNFPAMIKLMLPSHISGGFWLGLCKKFCVKHLGEKDMMMDLEDEDGKVFPVNCLVGKAGLSGGWRKFSTDHKLVKGDVVVFQLVKANKFMVYIVRTSRNNRSTSGKSAFKTVHDSDLSSDDNYVLDESKNGSDEDFGFDIPDGIRMSSESTVDFRQVKSFADFDIIVNGLVINSELSKQLQHKYYELCSSQKLFLHERILDGLNCKLIVGVISQTINIADAIRASELGTQQKEEFVTWESTLSAFEKLGMNVEFILTRLRRLMGLCGNVNRLKRLKTERAEVGEKVKALEALLEKWARRTKMIDEEIERLELNDVVDVQARYRELAKSPW